MQTTTPTNTDPVLAAYLAFTDALIAKLADRCDQCGVKAATTPFEKPNRTGLQLCASCTKGAICN